MKPGETIAPGSQKQVTDDKAKAPKEAQRDKSVAKESASSWKYKNTQDQEKDASYVQPISWTASEYIDHQKSAGWFLLVLLAIVAVAAVVYLLTDDLVSPIAIIIIGIAFIAFAGRPPQTLEYSIDGTGIHIDKRSYPYARFRSFAILGDEPVPTVMLIPIRRFDLPINLHFDEADAEKIIDLLGRFLPGEEREAPPVDRLMSKIRF